VGKKNMRRPESTFFLTSCPQRPEKGLEASQSQVKYARRASSSLGDGDRDGDRDGGLVFLACPLGCGLSGSLVA